MVRFQDKQMIVTIENGDKETLQHYVDSLIQVLKMKDPDNCGTNMVDFWVLDLLQHMVDLDCDPMPDRV